MELELANVAGDGGNKNAIEIFCQSQNSRRVDYSQMLSTQQSIGGNKRAVLQNVSLLQLHLCDTAEYFNQSDMTDGAESFSWKFQIRVQWRLDLEATEKPFAELQGEQASGFAAIIQPTSPSSRNYFLCLPLLRCSKSPGNLPVSNTPRKSHCIENRWYR